jgi:hypothetical protein
LPLGSRAPVDDLVLEQERDLREDVEARGRLPIVASGIAVHGEEHAPWMVWPVPEVAPAPSPYRPGSHADYITGRPRARLADRLRDYSARSRSATRVRNSDSRSGAPASTAAVMSLAKSS